MIGPTALLLFSLTTAWLPTGSRWNQGQFPIPYCITPNATRTNLSSTQVRTEILRGINAWRSTAAGGGMSCTNYNAGAATYQCSTVVNLNDGRYNLFFEARNWQFGSQTLGVTHHTVTGQGCGSVTDDTGQRHSLGCTYDADIEYNDQSTDWDDTGNSATDIASITTHEYGHFIGLGHCSDNNTCRAGTAVMNASYIGGRIRVPFTDDIEGACALYPGTPGGVGYPCTGNTACTSGICVSPGPAGYCSATCGNCPQGYACDTNPTNPGQMVCLRDDGTNKDICEECSYVPNACANNGVCLTGLPEQQSGRCATPCPNPRIMDGGCPNLYTCVGLQGGGSVCIPKSSDCTNLNNFTELDMGQVCDGDPACKGGLTCIGICSQECAAPGTMSNCPAGYFCESFQFRDGSTQNYCAPPVPEGGNCDGLKACPTGPCLRTGTGPSQCYLSCDNNPAACNNAQTCETYQLGGGTNVSVCERPGEPPRMDAGVWPDATPGEDASAPQPGPDGGLPDALPSRPDANSSNPQEVCACDEDYCCTAGCGCDPECRCSCDMSTSCDPDPSDDTQACGCDPECTPGCAGYTGFGADRVKGGCSGCQSLVLTGDAPAAGIVVSLVLGLWILSRRRRLG